MWIGWIFVRIALYSCNLGHCWKGTGLCPDAWILNYSNPEAMISEAIYRTYPDAKALSICDMPISQEETIADFLKIPHEELTFKYFGINHFGWFTNIYDKDGQDLLPALRERVLAGEESSW